MEPQQAASQHRPVDLWAFSPRRRGPLPRGASRADIEASFPDWSVVDETAIDLSEAPGYVRRADPRFYRLRRA